MLRATVKSVLARKLRLALTTLSIVLGVAFIAGTLVLADTLNATFDRLFGEAEKGTSVAVRAKSAFTGDNLSDNRAPVPESLLDRVRTVPGVRHAVGNVEGYAQLVDPRTRDVIANGQAPGLGVDWDDSTLSPLRLTTGRGPRAPDEIAIDSETAREHDLGPGRSVTVLTRVGPLSARVVGVFKFGSSGNLAGATMTAFEPRTAQRLIGEPSTFSMVRLAAQPGISQEELRDRVRRVLPTGYEALTGTQLSAETANAIQRNLSFFNIFLLVFAGIALFVGSFIIANTFTMLVAQRTRELALFRALGASRRQVTRSVLGEALIVGVVASTVGLLAGVGMAKLLQVLLNAIGVTLPKSALVLKAHTPIWAYVVGVGVTLLAAYPPARRAARVPPVAALRDDVALPERSLRRRAVVGGVLTAAGAVLVGTGLAGVGAQPAALVGLGAMAVFLGVAMLSPLISRPVTRLLGAPFVRFAGVAGRLARENALRNPRRTAATAAALMIGMALVSAMTVMASSIKASSNQIIDRSLGADYIISTTGFTPFSGAVAERVAAVPGIDAVTSFRFGIAKLGGAASNVQGVQPDTVAKTLNLDVYAGSLANLGEGQLLISEKVAKARNWRVGQRVPAVFERAGATTLTVGGVYRENQIAGDHLLSTAAFTRYFPRSLDLVVAATAGPGVDRSQVHAAVERAAAAASPNVRVRDQSEFKEEQRKQVDQLLALVIALLALAILIAVLGIVNTLALSVFERTREIGLLRAVGMSRRQLRRMIRLESVIIAVFGAVLGVIVGIGFGWALAQALRDEGVGVLVIPGGQLALYVLLAAFVGVLAAVLPARRAARLDVLRAIATT